MGFGSGIVDAVSQFGNDRQSNWWANTNRPGITSEANSSAIGSDGGSPEAFDGNEATFGFAVGGSGAFSVTISVTVVVLDGSYTGYGIAGGGSFPIVDTGTTSTGGITWTVNTTGGSVFSQGVQIYPTPTSATLDWSASWVRA